MIKKFQLAEAAFFDLIHLFCGRYYVNIRINRSWSSGFDKVKINL